MTKILETTDYDRFELLDFNRNVEKTVKLEQSMKAYGWLSPYPMHVIKNGGGKLKIKGGHHRFEVARKLRIPCKYVITQDKGETVHELEAATRRWTAEDYLTSFCRVGNANYIAVREFREKTGFPIGACMSLLAGESAGSGNQSAKFKDGTYKLGDPAHAQQVVEVALGCAERGVKFARTERFVSAISAVCRVSEFDRRIFLDRVEVNLGMMIPQNSRDACIAMIEQVYNYGGKKNRLALAFMANEIAAKRSATGMLKPLKG